MRFNPLVLSCFLPLAVCAVETPPLAFPDAKLDPPPLTLLGNNAKAPPDIGVFPGPRIKDPDARPAPGMPIVVPRADLDPKMVHAPSASVDYKLLVEDPGSGPSR